MEEQRNVMMMGQVSIPGGQPSGHEFLVWLACGVLVLAGLAFLIGLFNQAAKARSILSGKDRELKPQPFDVRLVQEFVKREECVGRHNESVSGLTIVRRELDELRKERKDDTSQLHEKINHVAGDVEGLKKSTEMQNQQLARMDLKLDRIVERGLNRI